MSPIAIIVLAALGFASIAALLRRLKSKAIVNPYGDELKSSRTGFGSDVSSQRLTPFEETIIERAVVLQQSASGQLVAVDLFSGYCAANARRLAELGFTAYAVDFSPADASISAVIGQPHESGGILHYAQQDMREFDPATIGGTIDLVTCQRGLHFLRYQEARKLIAALASQLSPGASMYFSIGAVDCAVGPGYKHADLPVQERWHPLEPELGGPIHVTEPLCLYKEEDIQSLFANLGGELVSVARDDFGLFIVEYTNNK